MKSVVYITHIVLLRNNAEDSFRWKGSDARIRLRELENNRFSCHSNFRLITFKNVFVTNTSFFLGILYC